MNSITTRPAMEVSTPLGVSDIVAQVTLIQNVMSAVMRDGEHYGKIPGCGDKPTLLQPGAQKLLMTFRLAPEYEVSQTDLERGHREYRVQATLKSIQSGSFVGQGIGCCSTMEGKFRFRVAPKKATDRPVPKEYWDCWKTDAKKAQELLGGKGFGKMKDENGSWVICEGSNEKVEHDNPADYYNTVLKMAKKRALVDATITATAASDIFTQDIEDMPEVIPAATEHPKPSEPASVPKTAPQPAQSTAKPHSEPVKNGENTTIQAVFADYTQREGTTAKGKPYNLRRASFRLANGTTMEASTFSDTIAGAFDTLKGYDVNLTYAPGKKEGTFDIVAIAPVEDNVPF